MRPQPSEKPLVEKQCDGMLVQQFPVQEHDMPGKIIARAAGVEDGHITALFSEAGMGSVEASLGDLGNQM